MKKGKWEIMRYSQKNGYDLAGQDVDDGYSFEDLKDLRELIGDVIEKFEEEWPCSKGPGLCSNKICNSNKPLSEKELVSKCCHEPVAIAGDERGTRYYICSQCLKACDTKSYSEMIGDEDELLEPEYESQPLTEGDGEERMWFVYSGEGNLLVEVKSKLKPTIMVQELNMVKPQQESKEEEYIDGFKIECEHGSRGRCLKCLGLEEPPKKEVTTKKEENCGELSKSPQELCYEGICPGEGKCDAVTKGWPHRHKRNGDWIYSRIEGKETFKPVQEPSKKPVCYCGHPKERHFVQYKSLVEGNQLSCRHCECFEYADNELHNQGEI